MADYDVVVVGAGNGGLIAACVLAQKGFKTLLLEKHNVPGGCATSFRRGRFEFEVALHQLSGMGSAENPGPLRNLLNKLGVTAQLEWVEMESLYRIIVPGQLDITLKADRAAAIEVLQQRFPQESDNIQAFFDLVYKFFFEMLNIYAYRDPEASPEKYPTYFKYAFKSSQEVLDEFFSDPLLQLSLAIYWGYMGLPPSALAFNDLASLLFVYLELKPYHVKGGSQALSSAILEKYIQAHGEVRFNCGVEKILVNSGRVAGVITEQGETINTSCVVSNASTLSVYTQLIDSQHVPAEQLKILGGSTVGTSAFSIYIGLDCAPGVVGINETTNFICSGHDMERTYSFARRLENDEGYILLSCYNISDPDASPPGTCQLALVDLKYGEPWLQVPPHQYMAKKYELANKILERAESVFPGLRKHIEEMEIATPVTHMRYLSTPGGAIYGFDQYAKDYNMFIPPASPIKGLYFAGAWSGSGGFQPTLISGSTAARAVINDIKKTAEVRV